MHCEFTLSAIFRSSMTVQSKFVLEVTPTLRNGGPCIVNLNDFRSPIVVGHANLEEYDCPRDLEVRWRVCLSSKSCPSKPRRSSRHGSWSHGALSNLSAV